LSARHASLPRRNLVRLLRRAHEAFHDGDFDRAERFCTDVLASDPGDFDALHLFGLLCLQRQRLAEALRLLSAAVRADPWSADALSNLGLALHATGKYQEAIACYHKGLEVAPTHRDILYNLGNAYLETGQLADALSRYRDVLSAETDHVGALVNRGNALVRLNDPVEALASYDAALAAMPGHPQILTNRGHALRRLDRLADALADFELAIRVAPDFPEARFEAGMARLTLGEFEAGFEAYEWRWKTGAFASYRKSFPSGPWLGDESPNGKTILLWAEQGFGDTIQFIRYAPALVRQGARVVCEVQPELLPLLSQLEGVETVAAGQPLPAFDLHCPMLSLPLAFETRLETIPAAVPYLAASAERQHKWRDRLPTGRARIGLAWSGSPTHKNDANRSMPLAQLAPLLAESSACFVGLQGDLRDGDAEILRGLPNFFHLGSEFGDFADTAAVISLLDVVISVDTAVAHLAGALGKQVLILLPHAADFRWMRTREDSPWYPTARLLRQSAFGDWDSVVARLRDELRSMIPAPSAGQGPDRGVRFSLTTSI
jgi:tetratricopeptide (TPR) repeat protein